MTWLRHGGIAAFVVRRLLLGVLVLFLVSVLVFAATQALGDPARAILGRNATPESLAVLQKQLNLDQSVLGQYLSWAGGLLQGDLGSSLAAQDRAGRVAESLGRSEDEDGDEEEDEDAEQQPPDDEGRDASVSQPGHRMSRVSGEPDSAIPVPEGREVQRSLAGAQARHLR